MKMSNQPEGVDAVVGRAIMQMARADGRVVVVAEDLVYDGPANIVSAVRKRNTTPSKEGTDPRTGGRPKPDARTTGKAAISSVHRDNSSDRKGGEKMQSSATAVAEMATWWPHARVAEHLGVDLRTLKARMVETPDTIERPWVNFGSVRSPQYRWKGEQVDHWFTEVCRWRTSNDGQPATGCAGGTQKASSTAGSARTERRLTGSNGSSSRPSQKDDGGSLIEFVKNLQSKE